MNAKIVKQIKVYKGHHYGSYKSHPFIRLKGVHLARFGFKVGDPLLVEISKGQITIKNQSVVI
jgi:hypothetical protein